jgi:hypothetical protein
MLRSLACALVVFVVASPAANACQRKQMGMAEAFTLADAVFIGRVVAVRKTPVDAARCAKRPAWCVYDHTAEVAVEGTWKGTLPARLDVFTGNGKGDCSFGEVTAGERWIFMTNSGYRVEHGRGTMRAAGANVARVTTRFGAPR